MRNIFNRFVTFRNVTNLSLGEHMKANNILKLSGMIMTGIIVLSMNTNECKAATTVVGEQSIAGITVGIDNYYNQLDSDAGVNTLSLLTVTKNIPENLGVSVVDTYLNIRKGPGKEYAVIGKLPKNAGCSIISEEDGWTKIKSGKVTGYVSSEYLATGAKAQELAEKVGSVKATVLESGLRVRESASTDAPVLDMLGEGEQFDVEEELVINKNDLNATTWVKISIDNEYGYLASEYVTLSYELNKAVLVEDLSGSSSVRAKLIETAKKYLGNRYVFGGNSLTGGIDCSGFVQQIFRMYGYSLPRNSRAQSTYGTSISASSAKAGDLVFYGNSGGINHVAICIGNGQIIHASNPRDGIKISNMFYRTPAKVVRVINN